MLAKLHNLGSFKESDMITVISAEAQDRFAQLLDNVQREPVTITRHGRTAAFRVPPQDMQDLQEARRKRGTAVEAFEAYFAKADATLTPAARDPHGERVPVSERQRVVVNTGTLMGAVLRPSSVPRQAFFIRDPTRQQLCSNPAGW